jgi:hypothetical protein
MAWGTDVVVVVVSGGRGEGAIASWATDAKTVQSLAG